MSIFEVYFKYMLASIITIGDEILIGQTVDTNSAWLGEKLYQIGFTVRQIHSISDKSEEIIRAIDEAIELVDLVIITGGLGPTNDDLTKKTLVSYFKSELTLDIEVLVRLENYFKGRKIEIKEAHKLQAMLPNNAQKLINNYGTASGMWFEKNNKVIISLPGVPYEVKGIMEDSGLAKIRENFKLPFLYKRTVLTWGKGESFIAEIIKDWEEETTDLGIGVAYLPSPGIVKIRVSGSGDNDEIRAQVDRRVEGLYQLISEYVFGEDNYKLEVSVGEELKRKGYTVASAESCTGGYIASLLTSIPGSSEYYKGSIIAYSNEIKINLLGVSKIDLEKDGAVSESVVKQMAVNIRKIMGSNYGIATSGIAGPDGGSEEKPVGTIWIAVASENGVRATLLRLGKQRSTNIKVSSIMCLGKLLKEIQV